MSRWWPDPVVVWLWPHKAEPTLAEFERQLDARGVSARACVTCVVAGEGPRYRVVPWSDELASPQQRQILAAQCFTEAYGEPARGWVVRQHAERHGAATLACAIDAALLDRVAAIAQARRLKLVSVQPGLMWAYNLARRHIEGGTFWFVWIDGPWMTLLLMSAGEPLLVKSMPAAQANLGVLLDREWFVLGMEAPRCTVYRACAASAEKAREGAAHGWTLVDLPAVPVVGIQATPVVQAEAA